MNKMKSGRKQSRRIKNQGEKTLSFTAIFHFSVFLCSIRTGTLHLSFIVPSLFARRQEWMRHLMRTSAPHTRKHSVSQSIYFEDSHLVCPLMLQSMQQKRRMRDLMDEWINGRTDGRMDGWMDGCIAEYLDG